MNQRKSKQVLQFFSLMVLLIVWCGDVVAMTLRSGTDTAKKENAEKLPKDYRKTFGKNKKWQYFFNGKHISKKDYEKAVSVQETETKTGVHGPWQRGGAHYIDDDQDRRIIVGGMGNS